MKKVKYFNFILCFIVLLFGFIFFSNSNTVAYGNVYDPYSFELTRLDVEYDISADYSMKVKEDIVINFTGSESTGFIRDIPVNAGDRVRNICVYEKLNGKLTDVEYSIYMEEQSFISIDIGDYTHKSGNYNYVLEYEYAITKPTSDTHIYLNAVGFGSAGQIKEANLTFKLPDGFLSATASRDYTSFSTEANTVYATFKNFSPYQGVTFDFTFEEGVLKTSVDVVPYVLTIIGAVLLAILIVVKLLKYNTDTLTPTVNFTAPDEMDPLVMGKYIDNSVNNEDVTSLIFYWASKGYITINLENKDDPQLIKIFKSLPDSAPEHQKIMYNGLFKSGETVYISSLAEKFYTTVERVTRTVNSRIKDLYDKKSLSVSILFAVLGALFMALTPFIWAMVNVSVQFLYFPALIIAFPAFLAYLLTTLVLYYKLKTSKGVQILQILGIVALCALSTAVYCFILSPAVLEIPAQIICCVFGFATVILSVSIVKRTDNYTKKLNSIIGFKNFILYAEKDKLEVMLESDPQFYYSVLPYAQVLGVTDKWEEKFKDLTVAPPSWITAPRDFWQTYFEIRLINSLLRHTSLTMAKTFVSRPAPKGASGRGGFGGGSFGGFSGGGHGGGGFRGR